MVWGRVGWSIYHHSIWVFQRKGDILFCSGNTVGDIWVYGTNTISVLMLSYGRTDYYVCVCVCVCAYMREDDGWIRASSLNTSTVVYEWMLLLRWKGLGDFSRDEAQSINKWLLTTPSLFHESWPSDPRHTYCERLYAASKLEIRQHNWLARHFPCLPNAL